MKKAEKQLHPHNYILSLNKRWLLPLMCSNPAKATYEEWIEKFHTVKELLKVLDIVNPGYSKDRGRAFFELSVTSLNITRLEYEKHQLNLEEFIKISKNSLIPLFQKCFGILEYEPEGSYDHALCNACKFYINRLIEYTKG